MWTTLGTDLAYRQAMKSLTLASLFAVLFLMPGHRAADGARAASKGLPAPEHVPADAQNELRSRMARHGSTMSQLVRAVVLLDRPTVRVLAGRIADDDLIASIGERRRLPLPKELFLEQSALSAAARDLAAAAIDGSDDRVLADRFSAVTRTCVTCHSGYLHGRPEPRPVPRAP
jgi:hypothetical protein